LGIRNLISNGAHSSAAFVVHHTKIGRVAKKKFGICSQRHSGPILILIFLSSMGRGDMNALGTFTMDKFII
jgi:hypothetical protein